MLQRPRKERGSGLVWLACGEGAGRGAQPALRMGPARRTQFTYPNCTSPNPQGPGRTFSASEAGRKWAGGRS